MKETEDILTPEERRNSVDKITPYMKHVFEIHDTNSTDQVRAIIAQYRGWLRGRGYSPEKVQSMSLLELLMEADTIDRSKAMTGEHLG